MENPRLEGSTPRLGYRERDQMVCTARAPDMHLFLTFILGGLPLLFLSLDRFYSYNSSFALLNPKNPIDIAETVQWFTTGRTHSPLSVRFVVRVFTLPRALAFTLGSVFKWCRQPIPIQYVSRICLGLGDVSFLIDVDVHLRVQ